MTQVNFRSINQLGNNHKEMIQKLQYYKNKKIFVSIADFHPEKNATNMLLETLIYISKKEDVKRKRIQKNGIKKAKQNGVKFGRPKKPLSDELRFYFEDYKKAKKNKVALLAREQIMQKFNISKTYFYKLLKQYNKEEFDKNE